MTLIFIDRVALFVDNSGGNESLHMLTLRFHTHLKCHSLKHCSIKISHLQELAQSNGVRAVLIICHQLSYFDFGFANAHSVSHVISRSVFDSDLYVRALPQDNELSSNFLRMTIIHRKSSCNCSIHKLLQGSS